MTGKTNAKNKGSERWEMQKERLQVSRNIYKIR
jgi:hypothetical protein